MSLILFALVQLLVPTVFCFNHDHHEPKKHFRVLVVDEEAYFYLTKILADFRVKNTLVSEFTVPNNGLREDYLTEVPFPEENTYNKRVPVLLALPKQRPQPGTERLVEETSLQPIQRRDHNMYDNIYTKVYEESLRRLRQNVHKVGENVPPVPFFEKRSFSANDEPHREQTIPVPMILLRKNHRY